MIFYHQVDTLHLEIPVFSETVEVIIFEGRRWQFTNFDDGDFPGTQNARSHAVVSLNFCPELPLCSDILNIDQIVSREWRNPKQQTTYPIS